VGAVLASSATGAPADGSASRRYRLTGLGLFVLGVAAGAGAVYAPTDDLREILVAFAGAGLFGAVLAYWIRPGATADVDPPERVYAALAETGEALARDLDLGDRRVYVPAETAPEGFAPAYLAVPGATRVNDGPLSETVARRPVFGTDERGLDPERGGAAADRVRASGADGAGSAGGASSGGGASGITVYPTGAALFDAFEGVTTNDLAADPVDLGDQISTGAVAGLELADAVDPAVDAADGRATVTVENARFGAVDRFDHPVASFLGVGFALGLDSPVTVTVSTVGEAAYDVTCEWDPAAVEAAGEAGTERGNESRVGGTGVDGGA